MARLGGYALPAMTILALMLIMEVLARSEFLVSRQYFPPVTEMLDALFHLMAGGQLWGTIWDTVLSVAVGLGIAVAIAVPAGILIGSVKALDDTTTVVIEFLRPVPSVALIPLAVLVYGNGMASKVFLIVFASVWPILIHAIYGIRDIDPIATDTARSFGFKPLERLLRVSLPLALPFIATGFRVSFAVALILAVTAELIVGNPGLGKEISLARQVGNIDVMYALIVVTGLVGWGLNIVIARLEKTALFWNHAHRGDGGGS
jgi:ABC-type nitrate/sulfonate/bicarbonate transport system permease component